MSYNYTLNTSMKEPVNPGTSHVFGWDVAISRNRLVMAAASETGAVYIYDFVFPSWVYRMTLQGAGVDGFGKGLALDDTGDVLIVGASEWDGAGLSYGRVHIYDWTDPTFTERGTLVLSSPVNYDRFGGSVAISGAGLVLIIGCYGHTSSEGRVITYDKNGNGWTQRGSFLLAADNTAGDRFGHCVACNNVASIIAVGAPERDDTYIRQGAVYIFDVNGNSWDVRAALVQPGYATNYAEFGRGCALDDTGNILIGGSVEYSENGEVTTYEWGGATWTETQGFTHPDSFDNDRFGRGLALGGAGYPLIAAAPFRGGPDGNNQGYVYYYTADFSFSGGIYGTTDITDWVVDVYRKDTMALLVTQQVTTNYDIDITGTGYAGPCVLVCRPDVSAVWLASTAYVVGDYVLATDPETNNHIWQCTTAGTSGGTEPTWNFTGTTTDNTVTWTEIDHLPDPAVLSPKLSAT